MDAIAAKIVATGTDPDTGYDSFRLGSFEFRRDEYFAHIAWPKGSHIIEIDRFLRAMVRDIGWGFFYGWIFFDDIFGTTNHYGTVDLFAGAYRRGLQGARASTTSRRSRRSRSPRRSRRSAATGSTKATIRSARRWKPARRSAPKTTERTDELVRGFRPAERMLGLPGDAPVRSTRPATRSTARSPTWSSTRPRSHASRASRASSTRSTCSTTSPAPTCTWNPSFTAITGASICCVTSEEHMLPVIHGNDRNEWFFQLTDEIHWDIADKNTGAPRGKIVMKAGDVCAMPADIRHQGFRPSARC